MKRAIIIAAILAAAGLSGAQMFAQLFGATSTARLPAEYQEVEYLQSSGTQYIDTGVHAYVDTSIDISFSTLTTTGGPFYLFGTYRAGSTQMYRLSYTTSGNAYFALSTTTVGAGSLPFPGKYLLSVEAKKMYKDGVLFLDASSATDAFSQQSTIYLFAANAAGATTGLGTIKLYSAEIGNSGSVVRNYVPAVRKSDSVAGMYDLVNSTFTGNAGTGSFTVGPDVN